MLAQLIAQSDTTNGASAGLILAVSVVSLLIYVVSMWKLFTKMGQPGWVGIIPLLNWYVIYRLAGREWWWVIILLIPCIQLVALWFLAADTAKLFAKELGWTIFLFLLPGLAHIVLAFGDSEYVGPNEQVI